MAVFSSSRPFFLDWIDYSLVDQNGRQNPLVIHVFYLCLPVGVFSSRHAWCKVHRVEPVDSFILTLHSSAVTIDTDCTSLPSLKECPTGKNCACDKLKAWVVSSSNTNISSPVLMRYDQYFARVAWKMLLYFSKCEKKKKERNIAAATYTSIL